MSEQNENWMAEVLVDLMARQSAFEYVLYTLMLTHHRYQPSPLESLQQTRKAMIDRTRFAASIPEGTDPDAGMAMQSKTVGVLERWFDRLEADLRKATEG